MLNILQAIFYDPLYNGLILLLQLFPGMDMGVAVLIFTVLVKLALLPFSVKAVKTQQQIKTVQPEIDKIKDEYGDDKQTQAMKMMEVYKERDIKPFSGFFLILVQLPIVFSLYYIFLRSGLPEVSQEVLYPFVTAPETIDIMFFGAVNVTEPSLLLAVLVGVTQAIQSRISFSTPGEDNKDTEDETDDSAMSFGDQFKKGLGMQMKYVLPFVFAFIAYKLSAVIAIYWATSNIFHIFQEIFVKKVVLPRHIKNNQNVSSHEASDSPNPTLSEAS